MNSQIFKMMLIWTSVLFLLNASSYLSAQTSWTTLHGPFKARDVKDITASSDGSVLYAADKTVLFKSTNSGGAWFATSSEITAPLVVLCQPTTPDVVVVGLPGWVKRSTDGGSSWGAGSGADLSGRTPLRLSVSPISADQMYLGIQSNGSSSSIKKSSNAGSSWSDATTPPTTGSSINDIAPYPVSYSGRTGDVWAGSSGSGSSTKGVWKSTNSGADWTQKGMTGFNVTAVGIVHQSPSLPALYAGTSTGEVYQSVDEGANWNQVKSGTSAVTAIKINSDNANIVVGSATGVYVSTNSGGAWTQVMDDLGSGERNVLSLSIGSGNQSLMYATTPTTVYKTTDAGGTWTDASTGLGRMPVASLTVDGSNIWTVGYQLDKVGKYNGSSWTVGTISGLTGENIYRNSSSTHLFVSGTNANKASFYRSTDGGSNFSLLYQSSTSGSVFKGSVIDPAYNRTSNKNIIVFGKDGTATNVYVVPNDGSGTKNEVDVGSLNIVNDVVPIPGTSTVYYGLDNEGVYKSTAGFTGGSQVFSAMSVKSIAVNFNVSNKLYAAGSSGLYSTSNSGTTWYIRHGYDMKRVIMSPGYSETGNDILLLSSDGLKIYYSSNGGDAWSEVQGSLPTPIYDIRGSSTSPAVVYASTDNGAYSISSISTVPTLSSPADEAAVGAIPTLAWNAVSGAASYHVQVATDAEFTSIVIDLPHITGTSLTLTMLNTEDEFTQFYWRVAANDFVGETDFSTSRSFDATPTGSISLSWSSVTISGVKHPRFTWTPTDQGSTFYIYRYSCGYGAGDCGEFGGWPYPVIASTTNTTYDDLQVEVAGKFDTPNVTYWYQVRSKTISNKQSVNSREEAKQSIANEEIPKQTQLHANYPNPFNPSTTIRYDLAVSGYVSLKVFDMLGREVATLVDEPQEAGYGSVEFDAGGLSSGIYFYKLQAGNYSAVKKLMLLK